ncbi:hypothetical protein [Spirillospora sp. CA-294931]|uniref:hypothetical protein n=1 Tax=Spirillospora sp. CA-294931 TaxID=3240042 RepID=UPI003D8F57A1
MNTYAIRETGTASRPSAGSRRRFVRHYAEMVLAMVVGMIGLEPAWNLLDSAFLARPDMEALVMATNMTIGMTVWMRHRGHSWTPVAEMGASMYVPFLVLFVPYWTGLISGSDLMMVGHALMLPAMLVPMLLRKDEYTHAHHHAPAKKDGPVAALVRRWPAGLAVLMTVEGWTNPGVPPALLLLALPGAYLLIGNVRRTLGDPRDLAIQIGGLVAYAGLALAALAVDETTSVWLIAGGWIVHGVWDVVHHRLDRVVPRGYAEWCALYDVLFGLTILLTLA